MKEEIVNLLTKENKISEKTIDELKQVDINDFKSIVEEIGKQELYDKFFTNGKLDNQKLCDYLQSQLSSRNANKGLLEAL